MGESDYLWVQQRLRYEIAVDLLEGALLRLARYLGVPIDDLGDNSGLEWDEAGPGRSSLVLREDLTGWGQGRVNRQVARRVDFSAAADLFGVSVARVFGGGLGDVGAGEPAPAPGIGGAVQVAPALPLTPRRASPRDGEGQYAKVAAEDIDKYTCTTGIRSTISTR